MISYLAELLACRSPRQFHRLHRHAGDTFTPLEITWLLDRGFSLPPLTQEWLEALPKRGYFLDAEPERYERTELAPDVHLFSDPDYPAHGKRLIVGFASYAHRLLMPAASFLQMLPSSLFDVVILADRSRSQFIRGISGLTADLPGLCRWLETSIALHSYSDIVCYGTSTGGLAALRAGHLLGSSKSTSMCGRFPGHVRRLIVGEANWPAFELLCACLRSRTNFVCVYSEYSRGDRRDVDRLARTLPVKHVVTLGTNYHVPFTHLRADRVRAFHARILDFHVDRPFDDSAEGLSVWETLPSDFRGAASASAVPAD